MGFWDFIDDVVDVAQTVARVPGAVVSVIYDEVTSNKSYKSSNSSYSEINEIKEKEKNKQIKKIEEDIEKFKTDSINKIKNKYGLVNIHFNKPNFSTSFNYFQQQMKIQYQLNELVVVTDYEKMNQERALSILENESKEISKLINILQEEKKCKM